MTIRLTKYDKSDISKEISDYFSNKNITKYDKETLFREFEEFLRQKQAHDEVSIPASAFSEGLSPLESAVKFMVENLGIGYSEIGRRLGKDRQVIWITYRRAYAKRPERFLPGGLDLLIPVSRFASGNGSAGESVTGYLREIGCKNKEIAALLRKDERTVSTWYRRFVHKNG